MKSNDAAAMCAAVVRLVGEVQRRNELMEGDLISIVFSQTRDLDSANPAGCLRKTGYRDVPLFCTQEPDYPDSMPRVIRVLITFEMNETRSVVPVYLDGAEALRPDLPRHRDGAPP